MKIAMTFPLPKSYRLASHRIASLTGARGVPPLDHKILNRTVKARVGVIAALGQQKEIFDRTRDHVRVELCDMIFAIRA